MGIFDFDDDEYEDYKKKYYNASNTQYYFFMASMWLEDNGKLQTDEFSRAKEKAEYWDRQCNSLKAQYPALEKRRLNDRSAEQTPSDINKKLDVLVRQYGVQIKRYF
jgi:hypothetical protein